MGKQFHIKTLSFRFPWFSFNFLTCISLNLPYNSAKRTSTESFVLMCICLLDKMQTKRLKNVVHSCENAFSFFFVSFLSAIFFVSFASTRVQKHVCIMHTITCISCPRCSKAKVNRLLLCCIFFRRCHFSVSITLVRLFLSHSVRLFFSISVSRLVSSWLS